MGYWIFVLIILTSAAGINSILNYIIRWVKTLTKEYKNLNELDDLITEDESWPNT